MREIVCQNASSDRDDPLQPSPTAMTTVRLTPRF